MERSASVNYRRACALVGAIGLSLAIAAGAAAEDKRFGQEILEILREQGSIDQEQYEELKAKEEAEHDDPKQFTVSYKNGLRINRNDGMVKLKIGGRIQADAASIHTDSDLDKVVARGDGEGAEFRRARLYMSGELNKRIIYKAQYDFAGGDSDFKDVYIGMKGLGPIFGTVKVGNFKQPYGLDELTSSKHITFMERSLPSIFDSVRDFGIGFNNHSKDKRITWAAGIFSPSNDFGYSFREDLDMDISGRVTGLPYYEDGGSRLLHLGFAVNGQLRDGIDTRFRQRPEVHLAKRYLDTGTMSRDSGAIMNGEIAWVHGPFSLQGEYTHAFVDVNGGSVSELWGLYAQASWFVTGEHKNYVLGKGIFSRVKPNNPFAPEQGKWGALELAARYSYIDLNNKSIFGGREENITIGANWWLYQNVRMMLNYVYASVDDTGEHLGNTDGQIHTIMARAVIEF